MSQTLAMPQPNAGAPSPAPPKSAPTRGTGTAPWTGVSAPTVVTWVLLAGAFVGLFHDFLWHQHLASMDKPADWGHSWMVPLISGYLLWQHRGDLGGGRPFWPGVAPLVAGIMCYVYGVAGYPNHMIQGWAMVVALFGLVLLLAGPASMRIAFFPIAYLVCGISVSQMLMIRLTAPLQTIASEGSFLVLQLLGITADLQGTSITVYSRGGGAFPLNIAEACSGLRMLIAFVALGAAVALVACRHWWQRVTLLALAVPVALAINILRVVTLAVLSFLDSNLAGGEAHTFIGTFLLIPGFLLYMLIVWALNRAVADEKPCVVSGLRPDAPRVVSGLRPDPPGLGDSWRRLRSPAFLTGMAVLLVSAVTFTTAIASLRIHLTKKPIECEDGRKVSATPMETASWVRTGEDKQEVGAVQEELGTHNYISRMYVRKDRTMPPIELHLAYYTGMVDTVPHVPERCFVGAGMTISGPSVVTPLALDQSGWLIDREAPAEMAGRVFTARLSDDIRYTDAPGVRVHMPLAPEAVPAPRWGGREKFPISMRITPFSDPASGRSLFAGYFFIANGATVASADGVRLLAFDLGADYAYYLKVQVSSGVVGSPEELAAAAASLLNELLPEIMRCVPDWVRVQSGEYPSDNPRGAGNGVSPGRARS